MSDRVDHVDIAKGISIILVALFHSKLKSFAPEIISSMGLFRVPLFFFLSGIFFRAPVDAGTFLLKKSDAILKPYFVTLLMIFMASALLGEDHLIWQLKGVFYGNGETIRWVPMWFLPHLFLVYCFACTLFKFIHFDDERRFHKTIMLMALFFVGAHSIGTFWYSEVFLFERKFVLPGLPFSLDLIFVSLAYFLTGFTLRKAAINFRSNVYMFMLSILGFIAVASLTDAQVDLNKRVYISPVFATIGAMCGIYLVMSISTYINRTTFPRKFFIVVGQSSLFVLIFHDFVGSLAHAYFAGLGLGENDGWVAVFAFLLSIATPVLIKNIVSRSAVLSMAYLPLGFSKIRSPLHPQD